MNPKSIIPLLGSLSTTTALLAAPTVEAQFIYTTNAGTIRINGYSGSGGALTIPVRINGLPVTSIGNSAFINLTSLTIVTIPDSITSIQDSAFAYCLGLTSVCFEGNAPTADSTVFSGDNIATVYYLSGSSGWSNTFAGRPAVSENAGEAQFSYTTNAGEITITGYSGPDLMIIPSAINGLPVTSIGNSAFTNLTSLASVTIPASVINIGDSAFAYCIGLTNVTIPDNVTKLGENAFFDSGLTSVTIPRGVTVLSNNAFAYCTSLASVTIPDSVTNIGTNAFEYCGSLKSITIPDSVRRVGDSAFENCIGLTTLTIPASVHRIEESAFAYCAHLASVTISNGVHSIGENAFAFCGDLADVSIPDSVTNIGVSAFYACSSLANVIIPRTVHSIQNVSFAYCGSLANVTISKGVRDIGEAAFYACSNLANMTIPPSVTNIGVYAFYACSSLPSITIPDNVRAIGDNAFAHCASLASVTIMNGVSRIGEEAFYACSSLASITIPASIRKVGEWAFENCTDLTSVYFEGNAFTADATLFSGDNYAIVFHLPGTTGWGSSFAGLPDDTVSLQVTLGPAAVIAAGAEWQVDGGSWLDSGSMVGNLSMGNHTLGFKTIDGWASPTNQTVAIKTKSVAKIKATYTLSAQGVYNGLFMQADATVETAGMLSGLDVTASGTYSGKLLIDGSNYVVSGGFNVSGQASNYIVRAVERGGPLALEMTLHWNDLPPDISGTVSGNNGAPWVANLTNELAARGSSSAKYTVWVKPDGTPPGYGYLLITNHAGVVALRGASAYGTSFSHVVPLSEAGNLPVYGNLYGNRGLLLGWISLENDSARGDLKWIKPASRSTALYSNDPTNLISVQGSRWTNP